MTQATDKSINKFVKFETLLWLINAWPKYVENACNKVESNTRAKRAEKVGKVFQKFVAANKTAGQKRIREVFAGCGTAKSCKRMKMTMAKFMKILSELHATSACSMPLEQPAKKKRRQIEKMNTKIKIKSKQKTTKNKGNFNMQQNGRTSACNNLHGMFSFGNGKLWASSAPSELFVTFAFISVAAN